MSADNSAIRNMKTLGFVFRVVAGITLAFFWIAVIPVYGEPFDGCKVSGYLTLQLGCSVWPQFISGFGFVLIAAVIAPSKARLHYVAVVVIVVITLLGGFEGLKTGVLYDVSCLDDRVAIAAAAYPLAVGGLMVFLLIQGRKALFDIHKRFIDNDRSKYG